MLYRCATWTMRSKDFSSLCAGHHKLLLCIIGFRRKDRPGYKPLSYREVLERTGLIGRMAVQGPMRGGRPATSWVDRVQKNLEAFGAVHLKGKGRKWFAFEAVVEDGRDWMTAAKNVDMWHRGLTRERKHSIAPGDAWTFTNPTCSASARFVNLYSSYVCDCVLFCLVAVVSMCFLPAIYRRGGPCFCFCFNVFYIYFLMFFFSAANPSRCSSLCLLTSFLI